MNNDARNTTEAEDTIWAALYNIAEDGEADMLDNLRLRAGLMTRCTVCGWYNLPTDTVCGNDDRHPPQAPFCADPRPTDQYECANCGNEVWWVGPGDDTWQHSDE